MSIIITEIMQNPFAVSDASGEWFEVFNDGPDAVDLSGWVVSDDGTDSFTIVGPLIIEAGGYLVFGNNADISTNGGVTVDYEYSGMFLGNSADELVLTDASAVEQDRVEWDGGPNFPDPNGASMVLIDPALDNNVGANWTTSVDPYGDGDLGTPGTGSTIDTTNIVITEIMQNPSAVDDFNGEWFEIHNAGPSAVNLNGWTISDNGSNTHIITVDLIVEPGGYLVLSNNADTATNGGVSVDYQYSSFFLANGDDEIILTDGDGVEQDRVEWDGGPTFPDPNGASMALIDPALDNNVGTNWTTATAAYGDGDQGTPGGDNFPPVDASIVISEIMQNPDAVFDSNGEWFEIYNAGTEAVDLDGWVISDNDFDSHTITGPLVIEAGAYLVLGNNADPATNGGVTVDYEYSGIALSNGADELVLSDPNGGEQDRVEWDGGPNFPDPTGASMQILDLGADNNVGANWFAGTEAYGDGDLGTPGSENIRTIPLTLISAIQGSGDEAAIMGEVKVQGVVTAIAYNGFFMQEEDADNDADAATSEGIFVFSGGSFTPDVGDLVTVQGTSGEFFGLTQINNVSEASVDASGQLGLVTPTIVAADANGSFAATDFEALEGMLLTFADDLTVTQLFNYERFGQLELSSVGQQTQYTQTNAPDPVLFPENADLVEAQRIILDDGSDGQNPDTLPYDYVNDGLSGGDVFENLTGVLGFNRGDYKVVASDTRPELTDAVQISDTPDDVGGDLKVATFNVLNYFLTLDTAENQDSVGPNGLDPRGANSAEELEIQASKIVAALAALDADVIGLVEIENDADDAAAADLAARLSAETGKTYAYVPTGYVGEDAIKVAFLYDTSTVEIAEGGTAIAVLDDLTFTDPINQLEQENRPALAVTFTELATMETFTAVNNHFKSKGSAVDNDPNTGDGEANGALTRLEAAKALEAWLETNPTGVADQDYVIMGDLNAYAAEDPITFLESEGYTNLLAAYQGEEAFTYRFSGEWGTLDYALANEFLSGQVTGATAWNINSLAPTFLDYNNDLVEGVERFFEVKPPSLFDQVDPTSPVASSDHDPIVFGLDLYTDLEISVDKMTVNGNDIAGDSIGVLAGGFVGWRYVVENLGEVDFDSVTLVDSDAAIGTVDAGDAGYMLVESIDADGILQVGETWTIDITGQAIDITDANYAVYENSVTATGTYVYLETDATDDSSYVALNSGYVLSGDHEDFGDTFRAIFTPDPDSTGRGIDYQLTATNPGQFRYDILVEDLGTETLTIDVPWPFVTQGSMAIEWYDSVNVTLDEDGALQLLPGDVAGSTNIEIDLEDYAKGATYGDTIQIELDPAALGIDSGFVMLSTHLDYGLKGVGGWEFGDETALAPRGLMEQFEGEEFIFASSVEGSADSVSVDNDFKAIRGIGGIAEAGGAPAEGTQLIAEFDDGQIALALVDEDGWYFFDRKTGKKDSPDIWLDGDGNGVVSDGDTLLAEDVSVGGRNKFVRLDLDIDDFAFV